MIPRVVIVGGGFAGIAAARALKNAAVAVTIIDRHNHHTFQPLLYQVATAGLNPADIAHPIRSILSRQQNVEVVLGNVQRIDLKESSVSIGVETFGFDFLVLAAGATHSYFGHPEWAILAPGLKSLEDATEIRRRILLAFEAAERTTDPATRLAKMTFVIVGAGPTGVELAGAIAELARHTIAHDFRRIDPRQARIILLEAGPRILASFSEASAKRAMRDLTQLGVDVRVGTRVTEITPQVVRCGDLEIKAATKIWAAGVRASSLAKDLGVPLDSAGRALVEPTLALPGHSNVFVVGDLAAVMQASSHRHPEGSPVPGVAPAAMQEGKHAAQNIMRMLAGQTPTPFRFVDKGNLATIGRAAAIAEIGSLRLAGFLAWLVWAVVHIYFLIDFRNRLIVLIDWTLAYLTFKRSARLITETLPPEV